MSELGTPRQTAGWVRTVVIAFLVAGSVTIAQVVFSKGLLLTQGQVPTPSAGQTSFGADGDGNFTGKLPSGDLPGALLGTTIPTELYVGPTGKRIQFAPDAAQASNKKVSAPAITANDVMALIGISNAWSEAQTFIHEGIKMKDTDGTLLTFSMADNATAQKITFPAPGAADRTVAYSNMAQTWTGAQTYDGALLPYATAHSLGASAQAWNVVYSYGGLSLGSAWDAAPDSGLARVAAGVVRPTDGSAGTGWLQNSAGCSRVTVQFDRRAIAANAGNKRAATGTTATMTTYTDHGYVAGDTVTIASCGDAAYNGTWTVLLVTPTTFTFTLAGPKEEEATADAAVTFALTSGGSPTYTAIPGLSATLTAARTYRFYIRLYLSSTTNGLFRADLGGGTASATALSWVAIKSSSNATQYNEATVKTSLTNSTYADSATVIAVVMEGVITVNAGGTFKPRFGQYASHVDASSVLVGSYMVIEDMP